MPNLFLIHVCHIYNTSCSVWIGVNEVGTRVQTFCSHYIVLDPLGNVGPVWLVVYLLNIVCPDTLGLDRWCNVGQYASHSRQGGLDPNPTSGDGSCEVGFR